MTVWAQRNGDSSRFVEVRISAGDVQISMVGPVSHLRSL